MKAAAFTAVLLVGSPSSCLAFLLPSVTTTQGTAAAAAAAAGGSRGPKPHLSSTVGRRNGLASRCRAGGRCSGGGDIIHGRRVFAARRPSRVPLGAAAGGGDGAGQFGGVSVDIFDALTAGDMTFVTEYVQGGGDCSVQDSIGDTPLMVAVESEQTAAVRMLVKEGRVDVNRASETTGETPLMLAAYYGHTNLARVLVDEGGADLECRNRKGETALSLACFWGNEDTVEYLLEAGADPNARSEAGERPGDSFDAVFVPAVEENFFMADEEADKAAAARAAQEEDEEEEDIMFDELDGEAGEGEGGKDVVSEEKEVASAAAAAEGGEEGAEGDAEEKEAEVQGPREVILEMLEKARAGQPVKAA
eukprot:g11155.t1